MTSQYDTPEQAHPEQQYERSRPTKRIGGGRRTMSTTQNATAPEVEQQPDQYGGEVEAKVPRPKRATSSGRATAVPDAESLVPDAESLVRERQVDHLEREQLNGGVLRVLQIKRRMGLYKLDHGVELQDQMSIALDRWLTEAGYPVAEQTK